MMGKVKRKTVMAREDLANRLIEIAKRQGYTLYDLVNMIFELVLEADSEGLNLGSLIEESRLIKTARKSGFTLGFERLWYEMAEIAYKLGPEETSERWFEAGTWLAKKHISEEKPLEEFISILKVSAWGTPEFKFESKEDDIVRIRILNPRFPESYTKLYARLLEAALETYGYTKMDKTISRGKIWIEASRKA